MDTYTFKQALEDTIRDLRRRRDAATDTAVRQALTWALEETEGRLTTSLL